MQNRTASPRNTTPKSLTKADNRKIAKFNQIINKENVTESKALMEELRMLCASEGGCINDQTRKKVWPILLHVHKYDDITRTMLQSNN